MNVPLPSNRVELRWYQQEAIDAVFRVWGERPGAAPLIVLPTGAGKSIVVAEIARRCFEQNPQSRVINAVHVMELVAQNYLQMRRIWPTAPAGIYAASLGRKDRARIVFGSVQSLARNPQAMGACQLLIIDEAHLVPHEQDGQYRTLIKGLRAINPNMRVLGLTATPWRTNSGNLCEPYKDNEPLFDEVAYELTILELLMEGFLSPLVSRKTTTHLNVQGVRTRGGEFVDADLDRAVNKDDINAQIVEETIAAGEDRRAWLVFAVTIDHARRLAEAFRERGIAAAHVSGETPKPERSRLINQFKAGQLRCLVSVNVLGTGFDAPHVDLIAMARPTKSPGLYLQQAGRGMRLAEGKQNCLLLDFAGNVMRHGLVDRVKGVHKKRGEETEEENLKECEACHAYNPKSATTCSSCGAPFEKQVREPVDRESKLFGRNMAERVQTTQDELRMVHIMSVWYQRHQKPGSPDSLRVFHLVPGETWPVSDFVCLEHEGYAQKKAHEWWRRRSTGGQPPASVSEALSRVHELRQPRRALVRREGKFLEIVSVQF